jgi:Flp pilus assembly protein TadD
LIAAPALFFLGLEILLRLVGFGYPTSFVVADAIEGRAVYRDNPRFAERFVPAPLYRPPRPFAVAREKPPGVYRVVVLGESAAMGDPEPAFGLARVLEVLLQDRSPGQRVEVISAAVTAINSHAVRDVASDCLLLSPDLFVVYMGNNEVVGPYGAGTVFGASGGRLVAIRSQLFVKRFRLGQAADRLGRWARPATPEHWGGMEMFVGHEVRSLDPGLDVVRHHFRRNLEDVLEAARGAGVHVLLSTVATNLKDSPPFASQHRPGLTAAEEERWQALVAEGGRLEQAGKLEEALAAYARAQAIDDQHAELAYRRGRCLFLAGKLPEAARSFATARDLDTLRFRADSGINRIIREAAAAHAGPGLTFLDAEDVLARQSPGGIPGDALFYEHVHLRFEGNYRLGREIVQALAGVLPAPGGKEPPTLQECEQRLGLTDWHREKLLRDVLERLRRPPFLAQLDAKPHRERLEAELEELRKQLTPEKVRVLAAALRQRFQDEPSWESRQVLAQLLEAAGRGAEALLEWRRVVAAIPHSAEARAFLSAQLFSAGRAEEALAENQEMRRRRPDSPEAYNNDGAVYASQRRWPEAERAYVAALTRDPGSLEALINLAFAQAAQGRLEEARKSYDRAAARPRYSAEQLYQLGLLAENVGLETEAFAQGRAALEIDRRHAGSYELLTRLFRASGRIGQGVSFFTSAAAADPDSALAHRALARFLQASDQLPAAADHYRRAMLLDPRLDGVHDMLAHVLDRMGRAGQAAEVLEQGLQAFPDRKDLYQRLAALYMKMADPLREIAVGRKAHARWPKDWKTTAQLAWGLATAPDVRLRNGPEAVELAEEAARATSRRDPDVLNTLAAAYALMARWDEALAAAHEAGQLAAAAGNQELAARVEASAAVYARHQPFPPH